MKVIRLLARLFSVTGAPILLNYDEVFSAGQPEAQAAMPAAAAIVDGEAWFHEVFAGAVF